MRQVHNKFSGQYDDIVQYFGEKFRPRLSHVLVRQQEVVIDNQQKMI